MLLCVMILGSESERLTMTKQPGIAAAAPLSLAFSGQGNREDMEDYAVAQEMGKGTFICVCDGHGDYGAKAAGMALAHMARLSDELLSGTPLDFARAIAPEFSAIHSDIVAKLGRLSGAAVLTARIVGDSVALAYAGDVEARIVSASGLSWRSLTRPHRLTNMDERFRVSEFVSPNQLRKFCREDRLIREEKCLQLTRSVGCPHFDPVGHISTPSAAVDWIRKGESLIIGSDGFWEMVDGMPPQFEPGDLESLFRCLKRRCDEAYERRVGDLDNHVCVVASSRA